MTRDIFNESGSNLSPFHQIYLEALRAIIGCEDDKANAHINHTRRLLKSPQSDMEVQGIKNELAPVIDSLHGDRHYANPNPGPWIHNASLVAMIGRHVRVLGNEKDLEAFLNFENRCAEIFDHPRAVTQGPRPIRA